MSLVNGFLSYLMVFLVFAVVGTLAVLLGIALRKNKDAKEGQREGAEKDAAV